MSFLFLNKKHEKYRSFFNISIKIKNNKTKSESNNDKNLK